STAPVSSPNPTPAPQQPSTASNTVAADIQRANVLLREGKQLDAANMYYQAALKAKSPQRERLILQASEVAAYVKDMSLARHYLKKLQKRALTPENIARESYVKASIALLEDNPDYALKLLPQQRGKLPSALWSKINRVRQQALKQGGKISHAGKHTPTSNAKAAAPLPQKVSRVAVLLPLSGRLSSLGNTILQGMQATQASFGSDTRLKTYDVANKDVLSQYRKAVADGADVVIGPLDKRKLEKLAKQGNLTKPVIGLNRTNEQGARYASIYQFGLAPEDESFQISQVAISRGQRRAAMLYPNSQWGKRLADAFRQGYQNAGGKVIAEKAYPIKASNYAKSVSDILKKGEVDMIFLAASPSQARLIRPMIQHKGADKTPVYATSHIYNGRPNAGANKDLDGIVYTEIPYVIQASIPGISLVEGKYPRLHAMGADALVIAKNISRIVNRRQGLQGKTGTIRVDNRNVFHRKLDLATFKKGLVQSLGQ
ncbi:MAG TPA: penicillin-binding protein activator, partial [Thiothrix sp.]|nr:penicillin-binding protein activator [Thiothrix sp.]